VQDLKSFVNSTQTDQVLIDLLKKHKWYYKPSCSRDINNAADEHLSAFVEKAKV
jgi:hypothetical protein